MSRHVSEKIVSRLHVTCSTKELFSRCAENYSATLRLQSCNRKSFSVLRQFFQRSSRKMGRKEQEDRKRKAAAKSCQSMDTFVRKLPRQESAVREDTPAAEVYRENLEGKSKSSRLLFSEILCEHQLQNILF